MRTVMASQQMDQLLLTFRIKAKEDSKVTGRNVARKVTRRQIAGPNRVIGTRPILREAETRNTVISTIRMGILSWSATESLRLPDTRS